MCGKAHNQGKDEVAQVSAPWRIPSAVSGETRTCLGLGRGEKIKAFITGPAVKE